MVLDIDKLIELVLRHGRKKRVVMPRLNATFRFCVILLITFYSVCALAAGKKQHFENTEPNEYFDSLPPDNRAINTPESIAKHEKDLAAALSEKNKIAQAADLYLHAFALAPQIFSIEETIAIAKLLETIDRRDEAKKLLNTTISIPHDGYDAELALAKILASEEKDEKLRTAKFYQFALQIVPQNFSYEEKIAIVKEFIKVNFQDEAKALLQTLVNEPHTGSKAETMLAKLRVSSGEFDAALDDVNDILQREGKNSGALLIKGGELRRRKSFGDAIAAYKAILVERDDFDARLGLTYCLLAIGQKQEAGKQFKLLQPQDEWQQYDYNELLRNIDTNVRPVVEYTHTSFSDSEKYDGTEQDLLGKINLSDWDLVVSARHRTTSGDGVTAYADTTLLNFGKNFSESWRISAGLGATKLRQDTALTSSDSSDKTHNIGEAQIDTQLWSGNAQLSYSNKLLTANAFLIQNEVDVSTRKVSYSRLFGKSLTLKTFYSRNHYSDDNRAKEVDATLLWALNKTAPLFSIGYSYRFNDYEKSSNSGYFDPQNYVANRLLLLAAYEKRSFYLYTELVSGLQQYERNQTQQKDRLTHVGITCGLTLWRGFRVELSVEKDDSASNGADYAYGDLATSLKLSITL